MKEIVRQNFDESPTAYGEYERLTGRFGALTERLYDAMRSSADRSPETVLDAGAGTGVSTRRLRSRATTVVAFDISRPMLEENPGEHVVQGDFDRLSFREEAFDAVAFTASLFLTPTPERAVGEARRVLKPGGVVGCVAPLGWTTGDGRDVFEALDRESRSPTSTESVESALSDSFDVESGEWSFETTPDSLRAFHRIPAMAARLYPRLDADERIERAETLLAAIDEPLSERWRWFVGR